MRSIVTCLTVLFAAGFLTGGPRDPHPGSGPATPSHAEAVSGPMDTAGPRTERGRLPDPRVGFRRLSGQPIGSTTGTRGCRPGLVEVVERSGSGD